MKEYKVVHKLMGSVFELIVVDNDKDRAEYLLRAGVAEIKRLEHNLTEYAKSSFTYRINENAGIQPVRVDQETYNLLMRCLQLSRLTQGSFDITSGPLKKLYNFKSESFALPDRNTIRAALELVGYEGIFLLDNEHVFLQKKGMHISFNAIGKGFAADCVKQMWIKMGVENGVINASGDLTVLGKKANGDLWKIGIGNPDQPEKVLCYLSVENASVATSGDYEQFFVNNGIRYAHTIDPKTGKPVTGIKSVTVVSPRAELSDALATAVFVMGIKTGIHFIDQLPQTHCLIVDDQNQISHSSDLVFEYAKE